ncbi:hypothetical protein [Roseburia inulinivorans]|uniref:hypothetical protein n=1 Tax=Roseburia inulinivorans TaxID=360807 RepID=UPI0015F2F0A6|nr:hypothetical protein [Roseburia inulinivorans]
MEIIKCKVEEIIVKVGYSYKEKYSDKQLNILLNYWYFFDEKEKENSRTIRSIIREHSV